MMCNIYVKIGQQVRIRSCSDFEKNPSSEEEKKKKIDYIISMISKQT
jgi:hypothetical protein